MKQILIGISCIALLNFCGKLNDSDEIAQYGKKNVSLTLGTDFFEELKQASISKNNLIDFKKKYILFNDEIAGNKELFENKEHAEFIKSKNIEAVDFITTFIKTNGLELNDMFSFSLSKNNTFTTSFAYDLEYQFYKGGKFFSLDLTLIEVKGKLLPISLFEYSTNSAEKIKTIQENLEPLKLDEEIFEDFKKLFLEKARQHKIEDLKKLIITKNISKYHRAFSDGSTPYYRVKGCSLVLDRIFETPVTKDNEPILGPERSYYLFIHVKEDDLIKVTVSSFEFIYNKHKVDVGLMLLDDKVYIVDISSM